MFSCDYCGKKLNSQRGKTQHTLRSDACREAHRARSSLSQGVASMVCEPIAGGVEPAGGSVDRLRRQPKRLCRGPPEEAAEQDMQEVETADLDEEL